MATDRDLEAFVQDVDELKELALRLQATWGELETKARTLAPRHNVSTGVMALPRLYHEVGVMLDDLVDERLNDDAVESAVAHVLDLADVVALAQTPREAVTA